MGGWKDTLNGTRRGSTQSQKRVEGMDYSTILQVPNTRNSEVLNSLVKHKTRLAKITGYNVKLIEQSGAQLSGLVQKNFTVTKCHWSDCATCCENDKKWF